MKLNLLTLCVMLMSVPTVLNYAQASQECRLFAATGDVTKDSISILAKERDLYWHKEQRIWYSPRSTHGCEDSIPFRNITIAQCSLTYKFVATNSIVEDQTAGYGINEYGLAIISHDMDSWDDDSLGSEYFYDQDYVALALARCKTAAEAIDLFDDVVLPRGINAEAYLIADPNDLWLLETTGHNWAAKPISNDVISSQHQRYNIRTEWSQPGNRCNTDFLVNAQAHGCDTSALDFASCFGNRPPAEMDPDLSALKDRGDITVQDMRKLLRDKASSGTVSACVIPIRRDKAPAYFTFMWDSRADPEYGNIFLPLWIAIDGSALPEHYTSWPPDDPACAWKKFTKVASDSILRAAAEPIWQSLQLELEAEFDSIEAKMQNYLDASDLTGLQTFVDDYVYGQLDSAYNLALHIIDNAGVPVTVSDLAVILAEDDLFLQWSEVTEDCMGNPLVVDKYYIYRDSLSFAKPGIEPFDVTSSSFYQDTTGAVGDTGRTYLYWVTASSRGKQSQFSGQVGEFDKKLKAMP